MSFTCGISPEEEIACHLADLAVELHKRGLMKPYKRVVEARDVLLLLLDQKINSCIEEREEEGDSCVSKGPNFSISLAHIPQDTETHRLRRAAA
jgi:hypothetical protein